MVKFYQNQKDERMNRCNVGSGGNSKGCKNMLSKFFALSLLLSILCINPSKCSSSYRSNGRHLGRTHDGYNRREVKRSKYLQMVNNLKNTYEQNEIDNSDYDLYYSSEDNLCSYMNSCNSIDEGSDLSINSSSSEMYNQRNCNMLDVSFPEIEVGEEVFEDCSETAGSNYKDIKVLMHDKLIKDYSETAGSNYEDIKVLKHDILIEDNDIPYGCEASDFTREISEKDIFDIIHNLNNPVPFRDMFVLFNNFHQNERKKFDEMQDFLKTIFDDLANQNQLREEYKSKAWTNISLPIIQELLKKDSIDFKFLSEFMKSGNCSPDEYINFINSMKLSWNFFWNHIENMGKAMIYETVTRAISPTEESQSVL